MGANRVGGANPGDPKGPQERVQQHRRLEKVEKVRQVDETENEGTRKKFRRFMDETEETETTSHSPSPFETEFHKAEKEVGSIFDEISHPNDALESQMKKAIQEPKNTPAPNLNAPRDETNSQSNPLPQSHEFWKEAGSSSKDKPLKEESTKDSKKKAKEEVSLSQDLDAKSSKKGAKNVEKEKQANITIPLEEEKKIKSLPSSKSSVEEETKTHTTKKTKEKERTLSTLDPESMPVDKKKRDREDHESKQGFTKQNIIELNDPSQSQLPPSVVPAAMAATQRATPYLSSEINPLFFQMVGTIYVMQKTSGVNRTEIELTSPSFANSKFFGSKIMIEKYATAPDSLNIRLTGSDAAVKSFNQNISNLYAAFENGTFDFRIGRITAEYSADKPVFKRRERESGSGGGDFSGEKNK